jgi:hypothetical protein
MVAENNDFTTNDHILMHRKARKAEAGDTVTFRIRLIQRLEDTSSAK